MTFWDFSAPFYDIADKMNGKPYAKMLEVVRDNVPKNTTVLEVAAGTAALSITIADKVESILCSDTSEKMLALARKKVARRNISNISFGNIDIMNIEKPDNSFDVVIAGQVLHLLSEPKKAAAELRRVAKSMVILPMCYTKNLQGKAKWSVKFYKLLGFSPQYEFDADSYANFLNEIGFENCEIIDIPGGFPMAVAVAVI